PYSSATTSVAGGTLLLTGRIISPVTVTSGSTLHDTETNGSVTVTTSGTPSPGQGPGILNTGNLFLGPGSIFQVELSGTVAGAGYDQVNVAGTASLKGETL